jgi:hypothetical protein
MFLRAIEKENANHQGGGGSVAELVIKKRYNFIMGDYSVKVNVCVDETGKCIGCLKPFADLTKQLQ